MSPPFFCVWKHKETTREDEAMEQGTMHQATITAEADGQRITATATEGRGIILNASKVGSISLQIDVHIDGPELRDLLEQITGALVAIKQTSQTSQTRPKK